MALKRGFHGRTLGALGVTWNPRFRKPFAPLLHEAVFVPPGVVTPAILHGGRFGEEVRPLRSGSAAGGRQIVVNIFDRAAATRRQARQIARDVAEEMESNRLLV